MTSQFLMDISAPDFGAQLKRLESHLMDEAVVDRRQVQLAAAMTAEEMVREATAVSRWISRRWGG